MANNSNCNVKVTVDVNDCQCHDKSEPKEEKSFLQDVGEFFLDLGVGMATAGFVDLGEMREKNEKNK